MIQKTKQYAPTISIILLSVIATILILLCSNTEFGNDFLANLLATIIGILFGIPVAIRVSTYQERKMESEKKLKILSLIKDELTVNEGELLKWTKSSSDKRMYAVALHAYLNLESWRAFSDGGELQWIKKPPPSFSFIKHLSFHKSRTTLIQTIL